MSLLWVYLIGAGITFLIAELVISVVAGRDFAAGHLSGSSDVGALFGVSVLALVGSFFWPLLAVGAVLGLPFVAVFWASSRRYTKQAMAMRDKQTDLRERAKQWDVLSKAPEQTSDTKRAARAAAEALRNQASEMVVPKLAKQKS